MENSQTLYNWINLIISESHDSGNFYFCFRWLLIAFKREFSFSDIMRLWEVCVFYIHLWPMPLKVMSYMNYSFMKAFNTSVSISNF